MRTRVRPSAIGVGAVFVLVVALVAPAGAAPSNNPFVGSWESIYLDESNEIGHLLGEREQRLRIGGGESHIQGRSNPSAICYGQYEEFMQSSFSGWGSITSEDPYVFEGFADIYCYTEEGKQLAFEDFRLEYEYDPDIDTSWLCTIRRRLRSSARGVPVRNQIPRSVHKSGDAAGRTIETADYAVPAFRFAKAFCAGG